MDNNAGGGDAAPAPTSSHGGSHPRRLRPRPRGIGLAGATFIVFLVLKLVGVIDWSWWWVTSPLWISAGLTRLFLLGVWITVSVMDRRSRRKSAELSRLMRRRTR